MNSRSNSRVGMGSTLAVLALSLACSAPPPPGEAKWVKDGAGEAELEADRNTCFQAAAGVKGESKRFDHIARGTAFARCMTDRGWRQVAADS